MRVGGPLRLAALLVAGMLVAGCSGQKPSDQPAVDALVMSYDVRSGVWPTTGWWNSANALTALTDYMIASGDHRYVWVLENTYSQKRNAARGDFANDFIDDTAWWALAWIRAYDLTGDVRYLQTAQRAVDFMYSYRDDVCGGGLWWTVRREYKHAITNELFIQAAAELGHRLGEAGSVYLDRAVEVWNWFDASGMINDDQLVNDGLEPTTCRNNGDVVWTYNQGVLLGGLVALARGTGDDGYLRRARELADASSTAAGLHVDGVLTEPCERIGCDVDAPSYKGIYVRNLGALNRALADHPYSDYLAYQAKTAADRNRTAGNEYGLHWAGPIRNISGATQQSAVDLLVATRKIDGSLD
jgi:predicted alpha-1,6-mannanase (GH76 family)